MHASPDVPGWMDARPGSTPLLLFAPHGGRRSGRREPGRHKVNDLHTAELTRELAAACDASCLVNGVRDRNELDLNRINQVRRHASWLPAALAASLEPMVAAFGRARILVIHGWNVVQPVCDVGIGMVDPAATREPASDGSCTVISSFLADVLAPLQRGAATCGITVTLGMRYPAAHPNNLLQLFTPTHLDDPDPAVRALATLAVGGRLDAVQLELGIPLRWPGPVREAFIRLLCEAFDPRSTRARRHAAAPSALATTVGCGGRVVRRRALQFADGALLGLSSIDLSEHGSVAGRLLLSPERERLALFTGELAHRDARDGHVPPLQYSPTGDGAWRVHFAGSLLSFPSLTPFLDLERGLARGDLLTASVDLRFRPFHPPEARDGCDGAFGALTGVVCLGGAPRAVDSVALFSAVGVHTASTYPSLRVVLPATSLGHLVLSSDSAAAVAAEDNVGPDLAFAVTGRACRTHEHTTMTGTATLALDDGGAARTVLLRASDGRWRATGTVDRLIPVRRPGRAGRVVHTTYARCRFADAPPGWLELSTEHAAEAAGAVAEHPPAAEAPRRQGRTRRIHDESE
jgi:hypothetical protein